MDAASNRSIDAVRDLREKVNLAPTAGRFKVYIIDEVHMLTTEAFNALLKTLEEPPSHAVFILATTEAHKLPETIVSRTQVFNFKPITNADLTARLSQIAASEGIKVTPEALGIITATARGGFRDAISLLDQLAGSGGETITAGVVRELLGYSDEEEVAALSRALAASDTTAALKIASRLGDSGAQPGMVATQLADQWRQILLTSCGAAPAASETVRELAETVAPTRIAEIIAMLIEITRSGWPQLALEAGLVRLTAATPPALQSISPAAEPKTAPAAASSTAGSKPSLAQPAPAEASTGATPESELWPKVLIHIKAQNNSLAALLQMYPVDFAEGEVIIKPRFNFHRDLFLKSANRVTIEAAAAKIYGRSIKVSARTEESSRASKAAKPDQTAELVSSALEILGGEIVE